MNVCALAIGNGLYGGLAEANGWDWYAASPASWIWIVLGCLVAIAAAALNVMPQNIMPWRTRIGLLVLRLTGFVILLLMLVQLELRVTAEETLAPNIAVLIDTSGSMGLTDVDGGTRLSAARSFADELVAGLEGRAEVSRYRFSWRLEADGAVSEDAAAAGRTELMGAARALETRERDLQAVILLTDGNDTSGDRGELVAPLWAARGVPVYPVVFGDPDAPRLACVKVLGGNDYVRLGDEFRLVARIAAERLEEQAVRVHLYEGDAETPLASRENVRIGKEPAELAFVVRPGKAGTIVYRVVAEGVRGATSDKLLVADRVILAAPIYFYGVPAQAKAFIDRVQALWSRKELLKKDGAWQDNPERKGFLVSVAATHGKRVFEGAILTMKYACDGIGIVYGGEFLVRGIEGRGEMAKVAEEIDKAEEAGKSFMK